MPTTDFQSSALLYWFLGSTQFLGLVSALTARLSQGSPRHVLYQWLFFACLGLVGLSTALCTGVMPGGWFASGTTLSLMVLTTTWEFRRSERVTAW